MRRSRMLCVLVVVAAMLLLSSCGKQSDVEGEPSTQESEQGTTYVRFGTGGIGGGWYTVGAGIATVLNEKLSNVSVVVESSSTVRNTVEVDKKEMELGISQTEAIHYAITGAGGGGFKEGEKYPNIRSVMLGNGNWIQIVVLDDSPIRTIQDLKGKKIGVASPTQESPIRNALKYHGLGDDDYTFTYLGISEQVEALKNHTLDVVTFGSSVPTPAFVELSQTNKIRLIGFEREPIEKMVKEHPYYFSSVLPADLYGTGVPDTDLITFGQVTVLITHADVSEDLVYDMVKTICENTDTIVKVHRDSKYFSEESNKELLGEVTTAFAPFHPGAVKYFEEVGIKIPDFD